MRIKSEYIIISIIIVAVIFFVGARFFTKEDAWFCKNGQWVKYGHPSATMPTTGCGQATAEKTNEEEGIVVTFPPKNAAVSSPLRVAGYVNGKGWAAFEGHAGIVRIVDENAKILGSAVLTVHGDCTKFPAYFETSLIFIKPGSVGGKLIFLSENGGGLPEKSKEYFLPVLFGNSLGYVYNK